MTLTVTVKKSFLRIFRDTKTFAAEMLIVTKNVYDFFVTLSISAANSWLMAPFKLSLRYFYAFYVTRSVSTAEFLVSRKKPRLFVTFFVTLGGMLNP